MARKQEDYSFENLCEEFFPKAEKMRLLNLTKPDDVAKEIVKDSLCEVFRSKASQRMRASK